MKTVIKTNNKMTNRELLMMLDGDLGERAVEYCIYNYKGEDYLNQEKESISSALCGAFTWNRTKEGYGFWHSVFFNLKIIGL